MKNNRNQLPGVIYTYQLYYLKIKIRTALVLLQCKETTQNKKSNYLKLAKAMCICNIGDVPIPQ